LVLSIFIRKDAVEKIHGRPCCGDLNAELIYAVSHEAEWNK